MLTVTADLRALKKPHRDCGSDGPLYIGIGRKR